MATSIFGRTMLAGNGKPKTGLGSTYFQLKSLDGGSDVWLLESVQVPGLYYNDVEEGAYDFYQNGIKITHLSGTNGIWVEGPSVLTKRDVTDGITASTTQTQGQMELTSDYNIIDTCANVGDVVTLPDAKAGLEIWVINDGANSCNMFPAADDDAGGGVDTAVALASGDRYICIAKDDTNWTVIDVS